MNLAEFKATLSAKAPAGEISIYLQAMWYDGVGNWQAAHQLIDSLENETAYQVHAYLHRKEGDQGNALYWYRRAGRKMPSYSLQQEWDEVTAMLLGPEQH